MKVLSLFERYLLRFYNSLVKKNQRSVFFISHVNCINDGYDIINYRSDNVLCLLNSVLNDNRFYDFHLNILIYDTNKKLVYDSYIKNSGFRGKYSLINYYNRKEFLGAFFYSSIVFTDNVLFKYLYKTKKQKIVCLGYYAAPFKNDYWEVKRLGYRNSFIENFLLNKVYDNYITLSDFCSREISIDSLIYLPKFMPLGYPRNDIFYEDNLQLRDKLCTALGFTPKYFITYAPTHRDYENSSREFCDKSLMHNRTLFGNEDPNNEIDLLNILEALDAVIIAKVHPAQVQSNLELESNNRIVFFSDLKEKCLVSLQEVLTVSDLLITDYSTVFYDFLLLDRPVIHYCYDFDIQKNTRGFAFNPIEPFTAGPIVYTFEELCAVLPKTIEEKTIDINRIKYVKSIIHKHQDGLSAERIKSFYFQDLFPKSNSL